MKKGKLFETLKWAAAILFSAGMTLVLFCFMGMLTYPAPAPVKEKNTAVSISPRPDLKPEAPTDSLPDQGGMVTPEKIVVQSKRHTEVKQKPQLKSLSGTNFSIASGSIAIEKPGISLPTMDDFGISDVFTAGDLDSPLMALVRTQPAYPLNAKQWRIEGFVTVRFVVTTQGTVDRLLVIDADPPGVFDHSVIRCVSNWRFKPGTVKGVPVDAWAETTIQFELKRS